MERCGSHLFRIRMEQDAQVLCRVVGLFAQRDLLITTLTLTVEQAVHQLLLKVGSMSADGADTMAEKLRNLVDVHDVVLVFRPG